MENADDNKKLPFLTRFFRAIAQDLVIPHVSLAKLKQDSGRQGGRQKDGK